MNKEDEINRQLNDIMSVLEKQDKLLFAIGIMVIGIGGMSIGIIGLVIVGMM